MGDRDHEGNSSTREFSHSAQPRWTEYQLSLPPLHSLLCTGLQIPVRWQFQVPVDACQHWTRRGREWERSWAQARIWHLTTGWLKQSQLPLHQAITCLSTLMLHWQHCGLLRELGLLCYTRWRLWLLLITLRSWCLRHEWRPCADKLTQCCQKRIEF